MKNTQILLAVLSALLLAGCPDNVQVDEGQGAQDVAACSGVPIPGAELVLGRTTGAPNTGSMELPALTAVCLKVESNTASGWVALDGSDVFGPSDFKNKELVLHRMVEGMAPEQHTVTAEIASTPEEHYLKVTAYYPMEGLANGSEINSVEEALLLGQAYIQAHADVPTYASWVGGHAVRATPLYSVDGTLEAFEIDVENADGEEAGYVVLERNELRPLLGAAWAQGPSLSEYLMSKAPEGTEILRFLWADIGIMGMEVVYEDESKGIIKTCRCPQVTFDSGDRSVVDHASLDLSQDEWVMDRREMTEYILEQFKNPPQGNQIRQDYGQGFFGVPQNSGDAQREEYGEDAGPAPEPYANCEEGLSGSFELDVPGGADMIADYLQIDMEWPEYDDETPGICATGCTPIAALMNFSYWDQRYNYLLPGSPNPKTAKSTDIIDATAALRKDLHTFCAQGTGLTPVDSYGIFDSRLAAHINQLAQTDVGWIIDSKFCAGIPDRRTAVWDEVKRGHPPLIHYWSKQDVCQDGVNPDVDHTGVVYGFIDRSAGDKLKDEIKVKTGWDDPPAFPRFKNLSVDAQGGMVITRMSPGCLHDVSASLSSKVCMNFDDIPLDSEWGRPATRTLSCMCIMRGDPDGSFRPLDTITKAEFLKVVLKLAFPAPDVDLDGKRAGGVVRGVCPTHWASGYVEFAHNEGLFDVNLEEFPPEQFPGLESPLLTGGKFLADEPITRKEAAYLLVEAGRHLQSNPPANDSSPHWHFYQLFLKYQCFHPKYNENPFEDFGGLPTYDHILATTKQCVFEGEKIYPPASKPRNFSPDEPITRIGAAKVACMARFGKDVGKTKCATNVDCLDISDLGCG